MTRIIILIFISSLFITGNFAQVSNIGNIINAYAEVLNYDACNNKLTVSDASAYKTGDTVLLIQMKGAIIDTGNSASFGKILGYRSAGYYEINYVKQKTGNDIFLANIPIHSFNVPEGQVQLIRVPYYVNANITSTLTCKPWNGKTGGVAALIVQNTLELNNAIDVSGLGFTGGSGKNKLRDGVFCFNADYYDTPAQTNDQAAQKGESFTQTSYGKTGGRGAYASGGGGGQLHNSGGGGGANGGAGGKGGYQFEGCGNNPFDNGGFGGNAPVYNNTENRIFMGGGAGAGHANNANGGYDPDGGNGGGIVIIIANSIKGNNQSILTNGNNGVVCIPDTLSLVKCSEGIGGGGGGGTVLLQVQNFISQVNINVIGGNGADMVQAEASNHGPGGGGGGGVIWTSEPTLSPLIIPNLSAGKNGVNTVTGNNPWGATPGSIGKILFNLQPPFTSLSFKKNIDSLGIQDSLNGCDRIDYTAKAYTNSLPINSWQWFFGDGSVGNNQSTSHRYTRPGNYTVKLVATDAANCKDSIAKSINIPAFIVDAGADTTVCKNTPFKLTGTGGNNFAWSPAVYLNDSTLINPSGSGILNTTVFYLTSSFTNGCVKTDSVLVNVFPPPNFTVSQNTSICKNTSAQLQAGGGDNYVWLPQSYLNNPSISNPVATPLQTTIYAVKIIESICKNSAILSTKVTVLSLPFVQASKTNDLDCINYSVGLLATGAVTYSWHPVLKLSNPFIANPIATPIAATVYTVTGKDVNGCANTASVEIKGNFNGKAVLYMPNAFTPNGDGMNDCYGIKYLAPPEQITFAIYNRWGQKVFQANGPGDCWNGNFHDEPQPAGTYIFYIKANTVCGNVEKKGTIVLIR